MLGLSYSLARLFLNLAVVPSKVPTEVAASLDNVKEIEWSDTSATFALDRIRLYGTSFRFHATCDPGKVD